MGNDDKNYIDIEVSRLEDYRVRSMPAVEVQEWLNHALNSVPEEYKEEVLFESKATFYYDDGIEYPEPGDIILSYYRLETGEERDSRLFIECMKEQEKIHKKRYKRLELYEELRKEFEDEQ